MANGDASTPSGLARRTASWLVAWGLVVWAVVAVSIRLVGHRLLSPQSPTVFATFLVATAPLMALVTYPIYRRLGVDAIRRPRAVALMSLPGMFLDALLVAFATTAFPNLPSGAVVNFGTILLFGYAVVLLTGFLPRR